MQDKYKPLFGVLDLRLILKNLPEGKGVFIEPSETLGCPLRYQLLGKEGFNKGHLINDLESTLVNEISEYGSIYIGIGDRDRYYTYYDQKSDVPLYFGDFQIISRNSKGGAIILFEDTLCTSSSDILKHFGWEPTYQNKGKVLNWLQEVTTDFVEPTHPQTCGFVLKDFQRSATYKTVRGVPYHIFIHKKLGVVYGPNDMVKKIPHLTRDQIKSVYKKFDLKVPSTIYKAIPSVRKPKETKAQKRINQIISLYGLTKSRRGISLMKEDGKKKTTRNQEDLLKELRGRGETLTKSQIQKVWTQVTGKEG